MIVHCATKEDASRMPRTVSIVRPCIMPHTHPIAAVAACHHLSDRDKCLYKYHVRFQQSCRGQGPGMSLVCRKVVGVVLSKQNFYTSTYGTCRYYHGLGYLPDILINLTQDLVERWNPVSGTRDVQYPSQLDN